MIQVISKKSLSFCLSILVAVVRQFSNDFFFSAKCNKYARQAKQPNLCTFYFLFFFKRLTKNIYIFVCLYVMLYLWLFYIRLKILFKYVCLNFIAQKYKLLLLFRFDFLHLAVFILLNGHRFCKRKIPFFSFAIRSVKLFRDVWMMVMKLWNEFVCVCVCCDERWKWERKMIYLCQGGAHRMWKWNVAEFECCFFIYFFLFCFYDYYYHWLR